MSREIHAPIFADRLDAGRQLGEELCLRGFDDEPALVLAIPRSGVAVGHVVAQAIGASLGAIIPGKLPVPGDPEISFGAITPDGKLFLDLQLVERLALELEQIKHVAMEVFARVRKQMRAYYGDRPPFELTGETVILVDDELFTGLTMLAAVRAVRRHEPARIVVAVPLGTFGAIDRLTPQVDDLICLVEEDEASLSLADVYEDFADLSDEQVKALLQHVRPGG